MSLRAIPEGPLRHGYTTGATATAAAKAALLALLQQSKVENIQISLPRGEKVYFKVPFCKFSATEATCKVIKNGGDDPDVTHGLEIGCTIHLDDTKGIQFVQGEGVGVITLPGLEIPVGEPAINPVPRQMIGNELENLLQAHDMDYGLSVEVFVPRGREIAEKTLNSRIGIQYGISILGTTGIVKPYSSESFIAAINQGVDVATRNGYKKIVINSGGRSERFLKKRFPHLADVAFVQYGNWIGDTLNKLSNSDAQQVYMGIMLGKAVKLAEGNLDTHSRNVLMNTEFMKKIALECNYPPLLCDKVESLKLARNLTDIFPFEEQEAYYLKLGEYCHRTCAPLIRGFNFTILLMDLDGNIIEVPAP
ncbi:MAG: cobalt-precorrin-5B (C(1))-methyltransferase CbiD [Marinifilaceae bacterium]